MGAHNCESQSSKLVSLLIDGVLAIDAGGLTSSLSFEAQLKLKAVLLTHQHYDHIRDVPALAINLFLQGNTIDIYSIRPVYDAISSRLLNGELYPKFLEMPESKPTLRFTELEPYLTQNVAGYDILAIPVNHPVPTVGYQITSPEGKTFFYTGDTGPGLSQQWPNISPQMLVIEVTGPNRLHEFALKSGHLTPALLEQELVGFRELKGYLPQVVLIHMNPMLEEEIAAEIDSIARNLNSPFTLAREGMCLRL